MIDLLELGELLATPSPPLQLCLIPPSEGRPGWAGGITWIAYAFPLNGRRQDHLAWCSEPTLDGVLAALTGRLRAKVR